VDPETRPFTARRSALELVEELAGREVVECLRMIAPKVASAVEELLAEVGLGAAGLQLGHQFEEIWKYRPRQSTATE
jgi:hypothetical protein